MRLTPILIIILLLLGGFWFVTTHFQPDLPWSHSTLVGPDGSGSPLELTEAHAAPAYNTEEQNNIAIYKKVLPSVVNITSTTLVFDFFYGTVPQQGQGSGFILDKSGHILTNFHVVDGANRGIEVMLSNKRRYPASVVGTDKVHDLPLLQIDAPDLQTVALFADSSQLNVGHQVYVPLGQGRGHGPTFDEPTENHTHVAEMALEIAKRQVETGRDVVILLDSDHPARPRLQPWPCRPPAELFWAASTRSRSSCTPSISSAPLETSRRAAPLTIIGTCLVDTGSPLDDVIYEEFKGTGNSELILDRKLAEKRIFPAIDVQRSAPAAEEDYWRSRFSRWSGRCGECSRPLKDHFMKLLPQRKQALF